MNLRALQSIAILLWGIQAELVLFAIPMALVWEARFFTNRRWELTKQDFYLLADLTSVCLILLLVFLYLNRVEYHFLTTLIQWLPILFFPLVIVIDYSTTDKMTLDVLFYSLRRQKQPVTQTWDMDYLLFGLLLIAAGTNTQASLLYFPITALLVATALYRLRSPRHATNLWILLVCGVFLAGFFTQVGIRESHLEIKKRTQVWLAKWIQERTNPLKTQTSMGQVGRLKASDEIIFRVKTSASPGLLQEASYDLPMANSWLAMERKFSDVPHTDDFLWDLNTPSPTDFEMDIYLEFSTDKALIPIPASTTQIDQLPATDIKQNYYGAVQGLNMVPSPRYGIHYNAKDTVYGEPKPTDLHIPVEFRPTITAAVGNSLNPAQPISSLDEYFAPFKYSLYQPADIRQAPLRNFLLERKAGHCEYFASATVLLLRHMGIPARYVVGYALEEYDDALGMFVVRQRHAHAWAIAYIDNSWQVVDTTPSIWLETEAAQATLLQPLIDFFSNKSFLLQIWWNAQKMEDYEVYLYGFGVLLLLILLWRISSSDQVRLETEAESVELNAAQHSGWESPVFKLEAALESAGFKRGRGERFSQWWRRIDHNHLLPILSLHNRWRFDPKGISPVERETLNELVGEEIDKFVKPED